MSSSLRRLLSGGVMLLASSAWAVDTPTRTAVPLSTMTPTPASVPTVTQTRTQTPGATPTQEVAYNRESGWLQQRSPMGNGLVLLSESGTEARFSSLATAACGDSLSCPCFDASADAESGGYLTLKEGADDGVHTWTLKVPDTGLSGSATVTLGADGTIPATAVYSAGSEGQVVCVKANGTLGVCTNQPSGGVCTCG